MRTSQILRHNRGAYAISPGEYYRRMARVRAYQRVLAMGPDVPVILDFRRWAGRPIAFRDAECTDPVQAEGDPLGGVRHPITWEIVATQEVSAERPIWTEEGALFNGERQWLEVLLPQTLGGGSSNPATLIGRVQKSEAGSGGFMGGQDTNNRLDMLFSLVEGRMVWEAGSTTHINDIVSLDVWQTWGGLFQGSGSRRYLDGEFLSTADTGNDSVSRACLGRFRAAQDAGYVASKISAGLWYNRALSDGDVKIVSEALS